MADPIRMPALGQVSDELTIVAWLKDEGETIVLGEPLLEIETDKATLEIEAAVAGTLLKHLGAAGETYEVGTVIAWVGEPGETSPAAPPVSAVTPVPADGPVSAAEPATISAAATGPATAASSPAALPPGSGAGKVMASPAVRRLAQELGVDLGAVSGTGRGGRIERHDVEAAASGVTPGATDAVAATDTPVPRHRQRIARQVVASATTVPQMRLTMTVDMTVAQARLRAQRAAGLQELTFTHLILRAVATALRAHPALNRIWLEDGPRYRAYGRVDVGLLIATDDNLLPVTIAEPDATSLADLVTGVGAAIERARRGALTQADAAPAAVSLSNLGMFGVDDFEALVDPGQTAMLAVGRVAERAVVVDGQLRAVPSLHLSLSIDHRVVDGAQAAVFLRAIRDALEGEEESP